jgi:murein DD-endopeptidase MepM/ murein hydrolase activator NlpD
MTVTGTIRPPARGERSGSRRPLQLNERSGMSEPANRTARRGSPGADALAGDVAGTLVRLQASLDRIETAQTEALAALERSYDARAQHIRGVLAELGIDTQKVRTRGRAGVGGPLVAANLRPDAGHFERNIHRISIARVQLERLVRSLAAVPVREPVLPPLELSSGFGVRMDPFIRAPAMHTGLDFRGNTGDPVRAAADGTVTIAGWYGSYGKMVEIDHGNGFTTRYGHMSAVGVNVGQRVKAGQFVGKIGTTGRSTGPHLHYETRYDGDAVDPQKFLRAGRRLRTAH